MQTALEVCRLNMCINSLHTCEIKITMIYLHNGMWNITKLCVKNSFLA